MLVRLGTRSVAEATGVAVMAELALADLDAQAAPRRPRAGGSRGLPK
jgi:hypothetical protein